jgi:uncharacterized small protein (DUF1192 family)
VELLARDLLTSRVSTTAMPLDEVTLLKQEIAVLRAQIEWLKKQLFGSGE